MRWTWNTPKDLAQKIFGTYYLGGTLVIFLFVIWLDVESNHVHLDAIDAAGNFILQKSQKFFF